MAKGECIEKYYFMIFAITFIFGKKSFLFFFFQKKGRPMRDRPAHWETEISAYFRMASAFAARRCCLSKLINTTTARTIKTQAMGRCKR